MSERPSAGRAFVESLSEWLKSATDEEKIAFLISQEAARPQWRLFAAAMHARYLANQADWQSRYGEDYPKDLDDWIRLAARAGISPDYMLKERWTARDIHPIIEGYLDRLADQRVKRQKPDTKPDTKKKSYPDDSVVRDLVIRLAKVPKDKRRRGWQTEIANELIDERPAESPEVETLLRQARRYRHLWETGQ